jgi:rhamnogalacturonyl hydrolase YesR
VWRWVTYQAPDLVVEVRAGNEMTIQAATAPGTARSESIPAGSLVAALADGSNGSGPGAVDAMLVTARASDGAAVMRDVLARAPDRRSPLHTAIGQRISRDPLAVARVLARRYPETPGMNYIPAVAWVHTLKLASLTGDESLRAKVLQQVQPWLGGEKPLFGDRVQLNAVAGTMVFAELAKSRDANADRAAKLAGDGNTRATAEKAPGVPQHGFGWTDDMFMATVVPARTGSPQALDAAARMLVEYAGRLQRPDGLFNHAADAPAAWGRGNGFAALGLMETLTALPASHPSRASVLAVYRRQMAGMKAQQAPDGMWRQVVDIPGSYREESVTALTLTAMARGIRLGWIDKSYVPVVQRAWRGLLAHVPDDGTVVDVCTSTGAGPTRRYYLDRAAVTGADDRGGAMALGAALEIHELNRSR